MSRESDGRCEVCGELDLAGLGADGACNRCGAPADGSLPGRGEGTYRLELAGLVAGPLLGVPDVRGYLVEWQLERSTVNWSDDWPPSWLELTDEAGLALPFADTVAARREWMRWDGRVRPDGKPSRPLTAWNIVIARFLPDPR